MNGYTIIGFFQRLLRGFVKYVGSETKSIKKNMAKIPKVITSPIEAIAPMLLSTNIPNPLKVVNSE